MTYIITGIVLGVIIGILIVILNDGIEKRIKTEKDPMLQQMLWQHYATWRNDDLPLPARNAGLMAINSHFEAKQN